MTSPLGFDMKHRYLASVYVDADSIVANKEAFAVADALGDEYLPLPANEMGVPRVAFRAQASGRLLALKSSRFDLSESATAEEPNDTDESLAAFCRTAPTILGHVLTYFGRRAHRLAMVRESILTEIAAEQLSQVCLHTVKPPPTFVDPPPFEWNWRVATRIARSFGSCSEETNTIATAMRLQGSIGFDEDQQLPFDRIRLDLDINTTPANTRARFEADDVSAFFDSMQQWQTDLAEEVLTYLNVGIEA